jgi:transcriptional regulator GlxA family with amidase domain
MDVTRCAVADWLEPTVALLRHEAGRSTPGARGILAKLADVFLAQALRDVLVEAQRAGLLPAETLRDMPIAQAVELIRDPPALRWTLATLAHAVGIVAHSVRDRLPRIGGRRPDAPPGAGQAGPRAGYLRTTRLSINAVAHRAGYDSDASLSKAFKREFGFVARRVPRAQSIGDNARTRIRGHRTVGG